MKKFVIERHLPGAGKLTAEELRAISQTSNAAVDQIDGAYHWVTSFVTDDKIYCVHVAESEEVIRQHGALGRFPVTAVSEVKAIIDSTTASL